MTDRTQPDSGRATGHTHIIRYALELGLLWVDGDGRNKVREALDALATLEAQLEAIGAGGVSGPLMGRASLSANAGEPVAYVEVAQKHSEVSMTWCPEPAGFSLPAGRYPLYLAAPPTAQAEGWTKTEPLIARSRCEWHEDDGPVVWWAWNGHGWAGESPWCGTPLDSDWPGYHTHWTPAPPAPTSAEGVEHG